MSGLFKISGLFKVSGLWRFSWILGALWVIIFPSVEAVAGDLRVHIVGLRNAEGMVRLALYDRPETFPQPKMMLHNTVVAATPEASKNVIFKDLSPGDYALALYHDENSNGEFDRGLFGWPLEGFGFSQGAKTFFGPPDFSSAAFSLGPQGGVITVELVYWQSNQDPGQSGFSTHFLRP